MTAVNVAATYLGFRYIDKIGRRKLSMTGYTGMALSAVLAGEGLGYLGGTAKIALIEVFPKWQSAIGLGWILICFAGLCLMAIGRRGRSGIGQVKRFANLP